MAAVVAMENDPAGAVTDHGDDVVLEQQGEAEGADVEGACFGKVADIQDEALEPLSAHGLQGIESAGRAPSQAYRDGLTSTTEASHLPTEALAASKPTGLAVFTPV